MKKLTEIVKDLKENPDVTRTTGGFQVTVFRHVFKNTLIILDNAIDTAREIATRKPKVMWKNKDVKSKTSNLVPWGNDLKSATFGLKEFGAADKFNKDSKPANMTPRRKEVYDHGKKYGLISFNDFIQGGGTGNVSTRNTPIDNGPAVRRVGGSFRKK